MRYVNCQLLINSGGAAVCRAAETSAGRDFGRIENCSKDDISGTGIVAEIDLLEIQMPPEWTHVQTLQLLHSWFLGTLGKLKLLEEDCGAREKDCTSAWQCIAQANQPASTTREKNDLNRFTFIY